MIDLSIIIPCKDSAQDLHVCLSSISIQIIKPASIIIVDDSAGSEIENCVIPNYPSLPITYYRGHGNGLPSALNLGFHSADTKYLTWLNSDDYYFSPLSLSYIEKRLCASRTFLFGNSFYVSQLKPFGHSLRAWKSYLQPYSGSQNIFTGSLFFSADLWRLYQGFPLELSLAFEYSLISFLFKNGMPQYLNKTIAVFNDHGFNLSSKFSHELAYQKSLIGLPRPKKILSFLDRCISFVVH